MVRGGSFWNVASSRIFFAISLVALLAVGAGVANVMLRRQEIEHEIEALRGDIHQSESKNEELRRLIGYFSTPEFREREVRLRLGLKKTGENVVVVPGGSSEGEVPAVPQSSLPNWQRWYNYFFSH